VREIDALVSRVVLRAPEGAERLVDVPDEQAFAR
jgi:hypothetical protein